MQNTKHMRKEIESIKHFQMLNGRVHKIETEHGPEIQVGLNRSGLGNRHS